MRKYLFVAAFVACLSGMGRQPPARTEPGTKQDATRSVIRELVRGQWKSPDEKIFRISGRVKVLDAHRLLYEDGSDVDINGVMEAPDLDQKGLVGGRFVPIGKEAAAFLTRLIGNKPVTCYCHTSHVEGKRIRIAFAFVGETGLNNEMVRNGWAVSDHSATIPLEVIAREHKRGLWRGQFVLPQQWRKGERLPGE